MKLPIGAELGNTKAMLFNPGVNYDFLPQIETSTGDTIEVVEEIKLLGIMVRSDMSWKSNRKLLCEKGYNKLWMLRNLKRMGASRSDLIDVYYKQTKKTLRSDEFQKWFSLNEQSEPLIKTRHGKTKPKLMLTPVTCRNKKYKKSPIPYLTDLLNKDYEKNR